MDCPIEHTTIKISEKTLERLQAANMLHYAPYWDTYGTLKETDIMNSAIGNFDSNGARMQREQTPENTHNIAWYTSKLLSAEDEIKRLQHIIDTKLQLMPDGTLKPFNPVESEPTNDVLNVLDYVTKAEWDHFEGLAMVMLANGATLFELQQRLMGLG